MPTNRCIRRLFSRLEPSTLLEKGLCLRTKRSSVITARSSGAGSRTTLTSRETDSKPSGGRWSRKMVVCRIALLDGTTFEPKEVDKNATGQSVFDKVIKKLDIIETDYFGLTYRDKTGKKFWIDKSKKISKQVKGGTWVFEFQVKFYSPDPMSLKEDITRYQLCLQLRVDIFNGKLPCSFVTYALLGSYTVQGELGDWDPIENGNGIEYLHDFDFAPTQQPELLEKIVELHKHHKGQTPSVAEAHYLENAKKLAMYGVDMHDAKDSNEKDIQLGICANGILIYKDRLRINRFVWPKILKLSYKRNHFYIKVRPDEFDPHEKTIGFQCNSHKLAKRLWKTCVEHHAFFRLKDADPPDSGTLFPRFNTRYRYSGRTAHQARKAAEQENREEPHISRTAERRSMGKDKTKSMDDMAHRHNRPDEEDMHDQKRDPNATLEMGPGGDSATLDRDGRQQGARPEDAADRFDTLHGKNDETAGPGYGDTSALSDGGKKTKKDKEEEKRRRKEEEQRRKDEEKRKKDEEKERKRLEKERKKHPGKHSPETAIDDDLGDAAHLAQSPDKDEKKGGGFFGKFGGKKSPADKSVEEKEGHVEVVVDPIEQQKPKPIVTWALPGMQELMEKQAATNQAALADNVMSSPPRIEIDEVSESGTLEADGTVDADVVTESVCQSESVVENQSQPKGDYSPVIGVKGDDCADPAAAADGELEEAAAVMTEYQVKEDYLQLLRETPDIQRESRYDDIRPLINRDPRFEAVDSEKRREEWFKEYTDDMMKKDFMRLLRETSTIHSQSPWREARLEIDNDPRFQVVPSEAQREEWFNEYVQNLLKSDYMQLLKDTPSIGSTSRWETARYDIELDPRFLAVPGDEQREDWFNEYIQNLKKQEFLDLLHETPDITSYSRYGDVRPDICSDPRFNNVDTETQREQYFNEYLQDLKKAGFTQLLSDTPDITGQSRWYESKHKIDTDPRYHAVDTDLQRAKWFNEYVNNLNGCGYGDGDFGMKIGDYKSIDRTQEFLPLVPPTVAVKKVPEEPMPFFEPAGETDVDALGQRRVPPPVAKKPRAHSGYDSEEDRLLQSGGGVPVTVETESYKYDPDADDAPRSTSNIPFVETKTHKVTYERDGIPYETEDSVLISAHSVTTKSQTIDTTTYKTERDGVIETRIERKITVTSDENDDFDHDALLRAAIEEVTNMNPDLSVEKIECMRQIEGVQQ